MFCTDPERQSLTQTADDGDDGSGDVDEDGDGTKAYLDLAPARHIEMPGWPHTLRDQSCTLDSTYFLQFCRHMQIVHCIYWTTWQRLMWHLF